MFLTQEGEYLGDRIAEAGHQRQTEDNPVKTEGGTETTGDRPLGTTGRQAERNTKDNKEIGRMNNTDNHRVREEP
jgi:hypothetical protein